MNLTPAPICADCGRSPLTVRKMPFHGAFHPDGGLPHRCACGVTQLRLRAPKVAEFGQNSAKSDW